jgi:hypothetical protein
MYCGQRSRAVENRLESQYFDPKREVTAGIEAAAEFFNKPPTASLKSSWPMVRRFARKKQTPEAIETGGYEGGRCARVVTRTNFRCFR